MPDRLAALCPAVDAVPDSLPPPIGQSLFCIDLAPIPDLIGLTGVVELRPIPTAFGLAVTRDGFQRHRLSAVIDSLPDPLALGDFRGYVAWATTVNMDSTVRLGEVRAGRSELGEIAWDQFRILISAERDVTAAERSGRLIMRGTSPSTRLMAHRDMTRADPLGGMPSQEQVPRDPRLHAHHGSWPMPPMDPRLTPMAGMEHLTPAVAPWLPDSADKTGIPAARPREIVTLNDGDTLRLEAGRVSRTIAGATMVMYAFNGQHPGPLIRVRQNTTIHVDFHNLLDEPSTVHWHGVRLRNRFDGVPSLTQPLVQPTEHFFYEVTFPDAGIYWYHPHHREDKQQDLGLYGNMLVYPESNDHFGVRDRDEVLILDDLLVGGQVLIPYGSDAPTHALMGRFGNLFLVNGETDYRLGVNAGEVIRFFLTNASNTRVFNVSFDGARMKIVAGDLSRFERDEWVESIPIAPAERYVVDVRFEKPGRYAIVNRVRALDHVFGSFFASVDTLGIVNAGSSWPVPDLVIAFNTLRENRALAGEIQALAPHVERDTAHELVLSMRVRDLPPVIGAMASGFPIPVDWNDAMGMMNWATTTKEVEWVLREPSSGAENMDVVWRFRRGEYVKLRIFNDPAVFHAMAHPIHVHGQRFLVLSRNGVAMTNRAWKDTALIQAGETVELLIEMSNPGRWMLHCHIAEHLGSGMMMVFDVEGGGS